MIELAPDVFAYGLAAGLSGSAFLAAVILLATDDGVPNTAALLGGVALVLAAAAALAALAADLVLSAGGQLVVMSLIKLALGVLLLSLAWRVRPTSDGGLTLEAKMAGMDTKLQRLQPSSAFRVGIGVAVLPKRLIITLLAGAAIGAGEVTLGQGLALVLLYVLTATALIWLNLLIFVLGGPSARAGLARGRTWVMSNIAILAFVVALLFGLLFTGQAIVELLA
jgi:hypothetical protein